MSDRIKVRVRMYRQGLGDCFLLRFTAGTNTTHMLIDCGLFQQTPDEKKRIRSVVEDVFTETGGDHDTNAKGTLDVLLVTHEHWDHVSGFKYAKDIFDDIDVKQVWLAWTENPKDSFTKTLKKERGLALNVIKSAADAFSKNGALDEGERLALEGEGRGIAGILSFLNLQEQGPMQFSKGTDEAMDYASAKGPREYCKPGGKPLKIPTLPGVRFYVLGPPRNKKLLMMMDPSGGLAETYDLLSGLNADSAFLLAAQMHDTALSLFPVSEARRLSVRYPFREGERLPADGGAARGAYASTYFAEDKAWRRIDYDWLSAASDLALQLDGAVNNTSLALAIELVDSGRVLLFPGDAQVGNWLSWHKCTWTIEDEDGSPRLLKAKDLLERTVLYKVGHHGSHNATLQEKGLEMMTSRDLVAMLPVDEVQAHQPKGRDKDGWEMPSEALYRRLMEKTRGRVLRLDKGWPKKTETQRPADLSQQEWKDFKNATTVDRWYIDFELS